MSIPSWPTLWTGVAATEVSAGDTAWVLVSIGMVLLMTPALAFFYGGLVRGKNLLGTITQSFVVIALISVQWVLWGYSLAFGPDKGGVIGGLEWFGLNGVGFEPNPAYAATIPHQAFMAFQMMFAIITPALISGAFAERMKFRTFLVFILLWATLVYDPLAHWVWGSGGWLHNLGALDFAGGVVVHISSGVAALTAAIVFGKRLGFGKEPMEPNNIPFMILGAGLLWFGWFGFNAGSALSAGGVAVNALIVTNTAGAIGALTWMTLTWLFGGKPSVVGMATGAVVGLASITPASGYVTAMAAIIIGMSAGILCFMACRLRARWGLDDSLDVWGCHGIGGTFGVLAAGLFATKLVNGAGANGLFYGNPNQFLVQALAVVVTWVFSFVMTWIILKVLDALMGLRVSENEEARGLDLAQHGETAYAE